MLVYTNIQHKFRKDNGITNNEYILADMVYHLSKMESGWCFANRETLASYMGMSKRTIINLIKNMYEKGFIEIEEKTNNVRTSKKWQRVYFNQGELSSPLAANRGEDSSPQGELSSPQTPNTPLYNYNNITIKNKQDFYNDQININKLLPKIKQYEHFVKFLFSDNAFKRPLINVLKFSEAMTYEQFEKVLEGKGDANIMDLIETMENDPKYIKGKVSFYMTLMNWIKQRNNFKK